MSVYERGVWKKRHGKEERRRVKCKDKGRECLGKRGSMEDSGVR